MNFYILAISDGDRPTELRGFILPPLHSILSSRVWLQSSKCLASRRVLVLNLLPPPGREVNKIDLSVPLSTTL